MLSAEGSIIIFDIDILKIVLFNLILLSTEGNIIKLIFLSAEDNII